MGHSHKTHNLFRRAHTYAASRTSKSNDEHDNVAERSACANPNAFVTRLKGHAHCTPEMPLGIWDPQPAARVWLSLCRQQLTEPAGRGTAAGRRRDPQCGTRATQKYVAPGCDSPAEPWPKMGHIAELRIFGEAQE